MCVCTRFNGISACMQNIMEWYGMVWYRIIYAMHVGMHALMQCNQCIYVMQCNGMEWNGIAWNAYNVK